MRAILENHIIELLQEPNEKAISLLGRHPWQPNSCPQYPLIILLATK